MTWEYVAGLFDGEGSIQLFMRGQSKTGRPWLKARLSIVQSDKRGGFAKLQRIGEFLKANGVACNFHVNSTPHNLSNRPMGNLEVSGVKSVIAFAEQVLPHSLMRKA